MGEQQDSRAEQERRNRERFPETAAIVDGFRRVFGRNAVRLRYAEENGQVVGEPIETRVIPELGRPAILVPASASWKRAASRGTEEA